MSSKVKPHELYLLQMIEVKRRFRALDWILGAKKPVTKNKEVDNESAFLQIRKIIELITFSAIISDEARYQKLRQQDAKNNPKDKGNYSLDWRAPDILNHLSKISPYFLPRPLGPMSEQTDGTKHFSEADQKITKEQLINIYRTSGGYVHIPNPYKINLEKLESEKKENAKETLIRDTAYLKSVIWEHAKIGLVWEPEANPLELDNSESAWLIWFGDKNNDLIRMVLASAK